jgi:hypothetical protein
MSGRIVPIMPAQSRLSKARPARFGRPPLHTLSAAGRGRRDAGRSGPTLPAAKPTGAIVAVVDLVDCVPIRDCHFDYAEGPWCWLLSNVRRLKPIPWRGRQKLFDVPWPQ